MFEAAFFGIPCVTCISRPLPDTLIPFVTGVSVPPGDPAALAEAILWYFRNPDKRREMGLACQDFAKNLFSPATNARDTRKVYDALISNIVK